MINGDLMAYLEQHMPGIVPKLQSRMGNDIDLNALFAQRQQSRVPGRQPMAQRPQSPMSGRPAPGVNSSPRQLPAGFGGQGSSALMDALRRR